MHKAKPKTEFPNEAIAGAKCKNANDFFGSSEPRDIVVRCTRMPKALPAKPALPSGAGPPGPAAGTLIHAQKSTTDSEMVVTERSQLLSGP
jgi:hypothetical protein